MEYVIEVKGLTKDYGHDRGVFDIDLCIEKGCCYGFLGPNGAGKTTTIRHLMGFSSPDNGQARILGMDCRTSSAALQNVIGYLPGEIAFPKAMKGSDFLKLMRNMRKAKHTWTDRTEELLDRFDLDPDVHIEDMSLGTRRKLAVVTAFMHDPDILILDEPTSGLDPVMQETFIDFIISEKKRGKTILLSSHIFHEVNASCDLISIIRNGRIVTTIDPQEFRERDERTYRLTFSDATGLAAITDAGLNIITKSDAARMATLSVSEHDMRRMMNIISNYAVMDFEELPFSLEDYFMHFYENRSEKEDNVNN